MTNTRHTTMAIAYPSKAPFSTKRTNIAICDSQMLNIPRSYPAHRTNRPTIQNTAIRPTNEHNASRLNRCLRQDLNANANFRETAFVCRGFVRLHPILFHPSLPGPINVLLYSSYRNVNVHDGLVEDKGHRWDDIGVVES
jgi:hypothetical protein